jgi:hypothetical protein
MLRCASSLVVAAYGKVRLTPRVSRALPAAFLRSRPKFKAFATFYEVVSDDREGILFYKAASNEARRFAWCQSNDNGGLLNVSRT